MNPAHATRYVEIFPSNCGMFSVFLGLVGGLHFYEKGDYTGVKIDQKEYGLYYSRERGPDWFSYYFDFTEVGRFDAPREAAMDTFAKIAMHAEGKLSRWEMFTLIERYIKIKPDVMERVDQFCATHFKDHHIIGVHYRGTDKHSEAPIMPYAKYIDFIKAEIDSLGADKEYRIFVATDEEGFLKCVQGHFPGNTLFYEMKRSSNGAPIHFNSEDPYQTGLTSIVDCLLLSRCSLLIRSSSNLSRVSACFSPDMPVIEVTQRHK